MSIEVTFSPIQQPFKEMVDYYNQKVNLNTKSYKGVRGGLHDRAFMVMSVANDEILADLRQAVDKAINQGISIQEFRKDFNAICDKWEWEPNQSRGWRARTIYETNMRTAYAAGRYHQLQEMKDTHPYWQYRHGDSRKPRLEHLALDGKIVKADDPWWNTYYPPNGWGCKCYVRALSETDMRRKGLTPASNPPTPKVHEDWQHAPGQDVYLNPDRQPAGIPSPKPKKGEKPKEPEGEWLDVDKWPTHNVHQQLPEREPLGKKLFWDRGVKAADAATRREYAINFIKDNLLDGKEYKVFNVRCGDSVFPLKIYANALGGHIADDLGRLEYLGYLDDLLNPQEVWGKYTVWVGKNGKRGKYSLRRTIVTSLGGNEKKGLALICQNNGKGELVTYTFHPVGDVKYLDKMRHGRLLGSSVE